MKLRSLLTTVMVVAVVAVPVAAATPASGAITSQVRVADAATYSSTYPQDHTVCLDGAALTSTSTTQTTGPFTVATGSHLLTVFSGLAQPCSGSPNLSETITVPAGASTIMLWNNRTEPISAAVFSDNLTCPATGQGRLVVRNAGYVYNVSSQLIDLRATPPGGTDTALVSNVDAGAQGTASLTAGSYTGATATRAGTTTLVATAGTLTVTAGQQLAVYVYGGTDGTIGTFTSTMPATACSTPTTTPATTTPATNTTVAATSTTIVAAMRCSEGSCSYRSITTVALYGSSSPVRRNSFSRMSSLARKRSLRSVSASSSCSHGASGR